MQYFVSPSTTQPTWQYISSTLKADPFEKGHVISLYVTNTLTCPVHLYHETRAFWLIQSFISVCRWQCPYSLPVYSICMLYPLEGWAVGWTLCWPWFLHRCSYHSSGSRSPWLADPEDGTLVFRVLQVVYPDYKSFITPGLQGDGSSQPCLVRSA